MRRILVTLIASALLLSLAPAANAARVLGGIGDQHADTFHDQNFKALKVKRTRLITAWDSIFKDPSGLHGWMTSARVNKLEPLIAFNPTRGQSCPGTCKIPSARSYSRAFKAFIKKYPWVKYYNFWNETNSATQPTGPTKASTLKKTAALYVAAKRACGRKCTVTGPDILDQGIGDGRKSVRVRNQKRMKKWVSLFLRYAGRRNYPKIWGFHNYGDTNYGRSTGTKFFLKLVRGQVWVTETGGIYHFRLQSGRETFPENASRQARATKYAYTLANKYRSRIRRLYYYQWRKNQPSDFFDAGIVDFNRQLRPAYTQLRALRTKLFR